MILGLEKNAFKQLTLPGLGYFLFSCSFNMLTPELPDYLSSLGEAQHIGLIVF